MKVSPTITLQDMATILRKALTERFGCEVEDITIASYSRKIQIIFDSAEENSKAMVISEEFRHKS